jgi:hypothetical protein
MELLIELIEILDKWKMDCKQWPVHTLTKVAAATSGDLGCALATDDEVECLTSGLKSHLVMVRYACISLRLGTDRIRNEFTESVFF